MLQQKSKIAVVADLGSPLASKAYQELLSQYDFLSEGEIKKGEVDVIIALGGDGLMLKVLHRYLDYNVCFYGMNRGSIGFLMNTYEVPNLIARISNAVAYKLTPLEMKVTDIHGNTFNKLAINEVSLLRQTNQAAKIQISVANNISMEQLVCDGLLVSTPAGSTAYNFAANGPILPLNANLLALTPIAPFRPRRWRGALLTQDQTITLRNNEPLKRPVSASADFQECRDMQEMIILSRADKQLTLLFDQNNNIEDRIIKEMFEL